MARYRVGIETRARILDATRELLAEQAATDVTLKAITERAGVGAGSFYNLFASKDAAVLEVVRAAIEAVDPDPAGLGRERVDELVDALVSFFVHPRTAVAARIYLQLAVAGALQDESMAHRVRRHHQARVRRFAAAFEREHPELDADEARLRAERLLASVMGACMVWLLDPSVDLPAQARLLMAAVRPQVA
jgi:AcrR family transcriptional regulator